MTDSPFDLTYAAAEDRYEKIQYHRTGNSGLDLPAFSFGLWQKFGSDTLSRLSGRSSSMRSTWALPISTTPTATAHRIA